MDQFLTNYYRLMSALSLAMDFSSHGLMKHHMRVTLISLQLGRLFGLSQGQMDKLFSAAMLHDAGSSTWVEKDQIMPFQSKQTFEHCHRGYLLFKEHPLFHSIAEVILFHHDRWDAVGNASGLKERSIPIESRIIHLADRVEVMLKEDVYILQQSKFICQIINQQSGRMFDPRLVEAFNDLSHRECFWLDLKSEFITEILAHHCPVAHKELGLPEVTAIAETMASVIDFKSPFTHRHSRGVANVSFLLAQLVKLPDNECSAIKIAGLLHDLGKLSIPDTILNKNGPLTPIEFDIIKRHTYYTFHILKMVNGFEKINHYASCHHESLNGTGYPFKLDSSDLKLGAKIIAVADIFTALTEDRPYRPALEKEAVEQILRKRVKTGAIDPELTHLLLAHYSEAEQAGKDLSDKLFKNH